MKKAEKLQKKKEAISKEVKKNKFAFQTRGKITKKESAELRRTHKNIFDWVLEEKQKVTEKVEFEARVEAEDENVMEVDVVDLDKEDRLRRMEDRKRMFMTRRLCRDILEEILTETVAHRSKEMASNVVEEVLHKMMVEVTVNKLLKEAEGYGHEVITGLEFKFNEKRMEDEMAVKKMLNEIQREERLEIQKRKKEDWRMSYWRLQEQEMMVQMRNLTLLEQAIFMEWETGPETVALEVMEDMDTDAQGVASIEIEDWDEFLESQEVLDYVEWMMAELAEMGMDALNIDPDNKLADMDLEMEEDIINPVPGYDSVEYTPATPGLSRKLGILELEDDECLCSTSCTRDHENVNDDVEVDECLCSIRCVGAHENVLDKVEVDECLCSMRCDGDHEVKDDDLIDRNRELENDLELEEGDQNTLGAHRGPGVGTRSGWKISQAGTSSRAAVPRGAIDDTLPEGWNDRELGIKYCPGLEIELPVYEYIEYKPRYSTKPYIRFGVGPCEEQPGGVDGQGVQAGRREDEIVPGDGEEMFSSGSVRNLIASWEEMELGGGGGGVISILGGKEEEGGRRKSKTFTDLCEKFGGLGDKTEGRTDKLEVNLTKQCSFGDVASTLLGPHFVGRGARKRLQFNFMQRKLSVPAMDNCGKRLASPSANQNRVCDMENSVTGLASQSANQKRVCDGEGERSDRAKRLCLEKVVL